MDYKKFDGLKKIVRAIRSGESVEGYSMEGNILKEEATSTSYRVNGTERLQISELVVTEKFVAAKPPKPEFKAEAVCDKCGKVFIRSKFNPYFTECQDCRRKERKTIGEDRKFTCLKCGEDFWVSKYHPYANPTNCPKCNKKEGIKRRLQRKKERQKAAL